MAIERSSQLQASEMEAKALKSEAELEKKWQNPQILSQIGTLQYGKLSASTTEISLTQAVPLSDKLSLRKEIADLALKSRNNQVQYFRRWVAHQAMLAAWKVYVTNELLFHGRERARRFSLIKQYVATRPRASVNQRLILNVISSRLIQLEKMQDEKRQAAMVAVNDLEYWLGKKISADELKLSIPSDYLKLENETPDTSKDAEFINSKTRLQSSQIEVDLSKKERVPDLILGGGFRVENASPHNRFTYGIIGINIPIWDTGAKRLEAARARVLRDEKYYQEAERYLITKQQNQIELVKMSVQRLQRFPIGRVAEGERVIQEAEGGFKQGFVEVNIFLEAETQSHELIDEVYLSWMNYLENLSLLQLMKAQDLNWGSII